MNLHKYVQSIHSAYIANRSLCQILDTQTNNSNLPVKLKVYLKEEIPWVIRAEYLSSLFMIWDHLLDEWWVLSQSVLSLDKIQSSHSDTGKGKRSMKLLRNNARVHTASTTYERHYNKSRRLGHLAVASLLTRRYFRSSSALINVTCLIRHSLGISGSDIKMTQRLDLV